MIRIEEVNSANKLDKYQSQWDKLARQAKSGDIFHTYEWITAWLDVFWKEKRIAFLFAWENDKLIGLAPFLIDRKGEIACPRSLVTPINGQSRRTGIIAAPGRTEVFNSFIRHFRNQYRNMRVILRDIRSKSPVVDLIKLTEKQSDYFISMMKRSSSPILKIAGSWESYLMSRSRQVRHEIRRKQKIIENHGDADFLIVTKAAHLDSAMGDIISVESKSWKERKGTSFNADPNLRTFYKYLGRKLARRGWLRAYILELQSRPIAHIYGVVYKNEYLALKTSYDERYKKLSPGAVLFGYAIKDAFVQAYDVFDFLGSESHWKNVLANDKREHLQLCIFPKSSYRCILCKLRNETIKPFIKKSFFKKYH